jgi:hypothetical protein
MNKTGGRIQAKAKKTHLKKHSQGITFGLRRNDLHFLLDRKQSLLRQLHLTGRGFFGNC